MPSGVTRNEPGAQIYDTVGPQGNVCERLIIYARIITPVYFSLHHAMANHGSDTRVVQNSSVIYCWHLFIQPMRLYFGLGVDLLTHNAPLTNANPAVARAD